MQKPTRLPDRLRIPPIPLEIRMDKEKRKVWHRYWEGMISWWEAERAQEDRNSCL